MNYSINEHSSIRVQGTKTLYFDPFHLSSALHDADVIFITHDHYDHFSPEDISKAAGSDTLLVVPESMQTAAAGKSGIGIGKIFCLRPDGELELPGGLRVHAVAAYNKKKPFHPACNAWCGYVVSLDNTVIYVAGDTDALEENAEISCDVAFLPVGGTYTMDPAEAAAFAKTLRPGCAIPTHYGSIVGRTGDGERFSELVGNAVPTRLLIR